MFSEIIANKWRWQECLTFLCLMFGVILLVAFSGGHLPAGAWFGIGLAECITFDVIQVLGRRRERALVHRNQA